MSIRKSAFLLITLLMFSGCGQNISLNPPISIDNQNNYITAEFGDKITIKSNDTALAVLKAAKDYLSIKEFDFEAKEDNTNNAFKCWLLQQKYKGITVENGFFRIYTTKEDILYLIAGQYQDVSLPTVKPDISEKEAIDISKLENSKACVVITHHNVLAWKVSNSSEYAYIDASTGKIISRGKLS